MPVSAVDRRQAKRFRAHGLARVEQSDGSHWQTEVIDISVNGALIIVPNACKLFSGEIINARLKFGEDEFTASALVVHASEQYAGLEFAEMSQRDFDAFGALVLRLARSAITIS
jgi:c-di-GMP-binding flagellar brake protein YcgR